MRPTSRLVYYDEPTRGSGYGLYLVILIIESGGGGRLQTPWKGRDSANVSSFTVCDSFKHHDIL